MWRRYSYVWISMRLLKKFKKEQNNIFTFMLYCHDTTIQIYGYVKHTDTYNIYMHRNPETLTTFFSSGTKLLLPSGLLGLQHEERERERHTQFLLFHLALPRAAHLVDPTGLASSRFENQLTSARFKSQLTAFLQKSPKILRPLLPGMTSFTPPVLFTIWGFYYDICDCHTLPALAWTPALNVCPYQCTKPNSSKPN